jgi:hypothetical protein
MTWVSSALLVIVYEACIKGAIRRASETCTLDRDMPEADAVAYWLGSDRETFVAEEDGEMFGTGWQLYFWFANLWKRGWLSQSRTGCVRFRAPNSLPFC